MVNKITKASDVNNIEINDNQALKEAYIWCNKEYFNSELSQDINIMWSERMTRKAGVYNRKTYRETKKTIETIKLSSHYHRKYKSEIIDTLVHEMIHAKYPKEHHGIIFKREMEKLNKNNGLNIRVYSSGRALVCYNYVCKDCGKVYERTNAIKNYISYTCGKCKGELREVKLA